MTVNEIQPPKTLQEFQEIRKTIVGMMGSPFCDQFMFLSLNEKLKNVDNKISELTNKP